MPSNASIGSGGYDFESEGRGRRRRARLRPPRYCRSDRTLGRAAHPCRPRRPRAHALRRAAARRADEQPRRRRARAPGGVRARLLRRDRRGLARPSVPRRVRTAVRGARSRSPGARASSPGPGASTCTSASCGGADSCRRTMPPWPSAPGCSAAPTRSGRKPRAPPERRNVPTSRTSSCASARSPVRRATERERRSSSASSSASRCPTHRAPAGRCTWISHRRREQATSSPVWTRSSWSAVRSASAHSTSRSRVAIASRSLGPNGAGKTTLLRSDRRRPRPSQAGTRTLGPSVVPGAARPGPRSVPGGRRPAVDGRAHDRAARRRGAAAAGDLRARRRRRHAARDRALTRESGPVRRSPCSRRAGRTCCSSTSRRTISISPRSSSSSAPSPYDGTFVIATHDRRLLETIGVTRTIELQAVAEAGGYGAAGSRGILRTGRLDAGPRRHRGRGPRPRRRKGA